MDDKLSSRPVEVDKIISRRARQPHQGRALTPTRSKIIKRATLQQMPRRRILVGGDSSGRLKEAPPTIILEKGPDDRISKITVKCPCGRHAELICEYD